jgi:hypothetical protein
MSVVDDLTNSLKTALVDLQDKTDKLNAAKQSYSDANSAYEVAVGKANEAKDALTKHMVENIPSIDQRYRTT